MEQRSSEHIPAPESWLWPDELDGALAAPGSHRVLLHNERLRVLEVVVPVGVREPQHTHRWPSVMIIDRPARIRYYEGDEPGVDVSPSKDPQALPKTEWLDPEGPHSIENLDQHDYHAYRIELFAA